jgi:signal peptidase I
MVPRRGVAPRRDRPAHAVRAPRPARHVRVAGGALVAFLLALAALRLWVLEPVHVTSDSMAPTVRPGTYALVLKTADAVGGLRPDDLVVLESPDDGTTVLKRVVALGGQEVAIRDAVVNVDDVERPEPGIDRSAIDGTYFGPVPVPPDTVFVLGDNRGPAVDSRHFGPVPVERVLGRVVFLWDGLADAVE